MGKASKMKKLRKLSLQLPKMTEVIKVFTRVKGEDVIVQGVTEVQGEEVDPDLTYRKIESKKVPLNHYKKMKKYYKDFGNAGIKGYANAILKEADKSKIKSNAV